MSDVKERQIYYSKLDGTAFIVVKVFPVDEHNARPYCYLANRDGHLVAFTCEELPRYAVLDADGGGK